MPLQEELAEATGREVIEGEMALCLAPGGWCGVTLGAGEFERKLHSPLHNPIAVRYFLPSGRHGLETTEDQRP